MSQDDEIALLASKLATLEERLRIDEDPVDAVIEVEAVIEHAENRTLGGGDIKCVAKFLRATLPQFVSILLSRSDVPKTSKPRVNTFFQKVLDVAVRYISQDIIELLDTLGAILSNPSSGFYSDSGSTDPITEPIAEFLVESKGSTLQSPCRLPQNDTDSSVYFVLNANHVGFQGGFREVLERLHKEPRRVRRVRPKSRVKEPTPLPVLRALLTPLYNIRAYVTAAFFEDTCLPVVNRASLVLASLSWSDGGDREGGSAVLSQMEAIIHTTLPDNEVSRFRTTHQLNVALLRLKSSKLDMRLRGLAKIQREVDGHTRTSMTSLKEGMFRRKSMHDGSSFIAEWLASCGFMRIVFGPSMHAEVAKRCGSIIRCLTLHNALTDDDLALWWTASVGVHTSSKSIIYDLILEGLPNLSRERTLALYAAIESTPGQYLTDDTLTFVFDFALAATLHGCAVGLSFFWNAIQVNSGVRSQLGHTAFELLVDLISKPLFHASRMEYVLLCVEQVALGASVPQCLMLIAAIGETFPAKSRWRGRECTSGLLELLNKEHKLLDVVVSELVRCARERQHSSEEFTKQIKSRFDFLWYCLTKSNVLLGRDQVNSIWQHLVVGAQTAEERSVSLEWLSSLYSPDDGKYAAFDDKVIASLFVEEMSTIELSWLTPTVFAVYSLFFHQINENNGYLERVGKARPLMYRMNSDKVIGLDRMWDIALNSENNDVGLEAVAVIARLHRYSLGTKHKRSDKFKLVEQALAVVRRVDALASPDRGDMRQAERAMIFLRACIEDEPELLHECSDEDNSSDDNQQEACLTLIVLEQDEDRSSHSVPLRLHPSQTIRELLTALAELSSTLPSLIRPIAAGRDLALEDDALTVGEVGLVDQQRVYVFHSACVTSAKASTPRTPRTQVLTPIKGVRKLSVKSKRVFSLSRSLPRIERMERAGSSYVSQSPKHSPGTFSSQGTPAGINRALSVSSNSRRKLLMAGVEDHECLFRLLECGSRVAEEAWALLAVIPVDTGVLEAVQNCPDVEGWTVLDMAQPVRLMYALSVVLALIHESDKTDPFNWSQSFTSAGGVAHLLHLALVLPTASGPDGSGTLTLEAQHRVRVLLITAIHSLGVVSQIRSLSSGGESTSSPPHDALLLSGDVPDRLSSMPVFREDILDTDVQDLFPLIPMLLDTVMRAASEGKTSPKVKARTMRHALHLAVALCDARPNSLDALCAYPLGSWLRQVVLISSSATVRRTAAEGVLLLSRLPAQSEGEAPVSFIIRSAISQMQHIVGCERSSAEFVDMLLHLLKSAPTGCTSCGGAALSLAALLAAHPPREANNKGPVDEVLVNLLRIATALLRLPGVYRHSPPERAARSALIKEAFGALFALPGESKAGVSRRGECTAPKCKTPEAREAAFSVLLTAVSWCAQDTVGGVFAMLRELLESVDMPDGDFDPTTLSKSSTGYVGLRNLGATCYVNSVVQQVFHAAEFRRGVLAAPLKKKKSGDTDKDHLYSIVLLNHFQQLLGSMQESQRRWIETTPFCASLRDPGGDPVNVRVQQDANEFLNTLFDQLSPALKDTPQERLLPQVFGGTLTNEIACTGKCSHTSERDESFYSMSVDVQGYATLEDSLAAYVEGDLLDGDNMYHCEECGVKRTAMKRVVVKTLPSTLCIHLKRFEFDVVTMTRMKVNARLEFPFHLNMEKYTREGLTKDASDCPSRPPEYYEYKLAGVVVHHGGVDSGHYYSFIKDRAAEDDEEWFEFNDTVVSSWKVDDLEKECFGGPPTEGEHERTPGGRRRELRPLSKQQKRARNNNAYLLFYERRVPLAPLMSSRRQLDESTEHSSLTVCSVSHSDDDDNTADTLAVPGGDTEWSLQRVFDRKSTHDAGGDGAVPSTVRQRVLADNTRLLRLQQVYGWRFMSFMWDLSYARDSKASSLEHDCDLQAACLFSLFAFFVVGRHVKQPMLALWRDRLQAVYSRNVQACTWFLGLLSQPSKDSALAWDLTSWSACASATLREVVADVAAHAVACLSRSARDTAGDRVLANFLTAASKPATTTFHRRLVLGLANAVGPPEAAVLVDHGQALEHLVTWYTGSKDDGVFEAFVALYAAYVQSKEGPDREPAAVARRLFDLAVQTQPLDDQSISALALLISRSRSGTKTVVASSLGRLSTMKDDAIPFLFHICSLPTQLSDDLAEWRIDYVMSYIVSIISSTSSSQVAQCGASTLQRIKSASSVATSWLHDPGHHAAVTSAFATFKLSL